MPKPKDRAEEDGDTAVSVDATATNELPLDGSANTVTDAQTRKPWQFAPGNRANPHGRPRKGMSVLEQTRAEAERKAKAVAKAHVARMLKEDATGNRAWAEYRDTYYGMPKQTLVLEQGQSGADQLDAAILAMLDAPNVVDAQSYTVSETPET